MCGIAAVFSPEKNSSHLQRVSALTQGVDHRGDRAPKIRIFDAFAVGCARLAIVDRQLGIQPMSDAGQRYWAVYNGELYNYKQLRTTLEEAGCRFRTNCDTEILVHGFKTWGDELPAKLDGMYAFVVIDREQQSFLAARDPFGIKPLYYGSLGGTSFFSSEIYALSTIVGPSLKALPPGSILTNTYLRERVLCRDVTPARESAIDVGSAIEGVRAGLRDSVLRHLPEDDNLKVAVFCSGGIDSSALLYEAVNACRVLKKNPREKLVAYCIGSPDSEDHKFASRLAWQLGVRYAFEEIRVDDMVQSIPFAVEVMETFEPNHIRAGTTSIALARRVRQDNIKVALVGEGADELFGGYEEFPMAMKAGGPDKVTALLRLFASQLHRTQLRRVDRTTMRFGIEARVPFLDKRFTDYALALPTEYKVRRLEGGAVVGKYVLREAYRGLLPDDFVDRRKVPMGEGAGVGDNRPAGPFFSSCENRLTDSQYHDLVTRFPQFHLKNKEEAYYFDLFQRRFGPLELAADRPYTNVAQTTQAEPETPCRSN